jgi:hypothetical protein
VSKNTKPTRQSGEFFFPLTYRFYIFGQLFSDLASENTELLASLASVLKNLSTPLLCPSTPGHCSDLVRQGLVSETQLAL